MTTTMRYMLLSCPSPSTTLGHALFIQVNPSPVTFRYSELNLAGYSQLLLITALFQLVSQRYFKLTSSLSNSNVLLLLLIAEVQVQLLQQSLNRKAI